MNARLSYCLYLNVNYHFSVHMEGKCSGLEAAAKLTSVVIHVPLRPSLVPILDLHILGQRYPTLEVNQACLALV